jgi:aryl-alcohol dehydrogenase-like predicted oxidoreductase
MRAVEDSLRRLQTDHIDLYQVHRPRRPLPRILRDAWTFEAVTEQAPGRDPEGFTVSDEDRAALDAIFPPGTHVSEFYKADFGPNARWS